MGSANPRIEWSKISGKQCLRFTFIERLTAADAEDAIAEWKKAFQSKMNESIPLVWDCRKMKGYESAARSKWTDALKDMKQQIGKIWLITDSNIIKMGASVMGMFTSLDIKIVSSDSEIVI